MAKVLINEKNGIAFPALVTLPPTSETIHVTSKVFTGYFTVGHKRANLTYREQQSEVSCESN